MSDIPIIYGLTKLSIEGYDDYQKIRIAQNNRIRDILRRKSEGIPLDYPEDKKETKEYSGKYKTEKLPALLKDLKKKKKISKQEMEYIQLYNKLSDQAEKIETEYMKLMKKFLKEEPIWTDWLQNIRGIGPVLGAGLIKNFGYCETYAHVSSLWRHCGYDPEGAQGRTKGQKVHYNPKYKTFVWKLSETFIKQRTEPYRKIYDDEKKRQLVLMKKCKCKTCGESPDKHKRDSRKFKDSKFHCKDGGKYDPTISQSPMSLKHADNRAKRKAVKIFLQHYWVVTRKMKKLEISMPYPFEKLGETHTHYIPPPTITPMEATV